MTITQEQLKPCPFCGAAPERQVAYRSWPHDDVRRTACANEECPAQPSAGTDEAWNRRTAHPSLAEEAERLREALRKIERYTHEYGTREIARAALDETTTPLTATPEG